jgi:phosphatidylinositol 4-kinase A
MKAEDKVLEDVDQALKTVANIGSTASGSQKALKNKQDLVHLLLDSERVRLRVWLFPLDHERRSYISAFGSRPSYEVRHLFSTCSFCYLSDHLSGCLIFASTGLD